jgi:hypothetical protein
MWIANLACISVGRAKGSGCDGMRKEIAVVMRGGACLSEEESQGCTDCGLLGVEQRRFIAVVLDVDARSRADDPW